MVARKGAPPGLMWSTPSGISLAELERQWQLPMPAEDEDSQPADSQESAVSRRSLHGLPSDAAKSSESLPQILLRGLASGVLLTMLAGAGAGSSRRKS